MTQPAPKHQSRRWTAEDLEALSDLAGELPWPLVAERFNQRRPPRTPTAMQQKAEQLGLSMQPQGEFISIGVIKTLTGYSYEKIYNWIKIGLPAVARSNAKNSPRFISRMHLRKFAKKHPEQFGGIAQSELTQLIDSEIIASKITKMQLPRLTKSYVIECVETGHRYPSIAAAAKEIFIHKKSIWNAVTNGTAVCGLHYRRVVKPVKQDLK
jgi:hypothetical protein